MESSPAELPDLPEAPSGVRIIRAANGEEFLPELVYRGFIMGAHRWELAGVRLQEGDILHVDHMPEQAVVGCAWRAGG